MCLGLTVSNGCPVISRWNVPAWELVHCVNLWAATWCQAEHLKDFTWSSVQVNLNTVSKKHTDSNNEGPSLITVAGDFEGGEFQMEDDKEVDLRGHVWRFDGRRVHGSKEFRGTRISLIWFCHTSWRQTTPEQRAVLKNKGFRLPDSQTGNSV